MAMFNENQRMNNKFVKVIPIISNPINDKIINFYITFIDDVKTINGTCKIDFLISIPEWHRSWLAPINNLCKEDWIQELSKPFDEKLKNEMPFVAEELSELDLKGFYNQNVDG
ncbi:hypothetical protein [Sporosarcina sp. E16_8]|uniref:hypothetical protein n=1 Tax=Sporosarcina sp. E16_8 TaxID=2789295 RepID=UPI001A934D17|nr:hypothetical protein [Sporosarcina sp. E16_8]MBO0589098.1 hypothetical protein [Sporosarcina sp. E16_8]